MRLDNTSDRIRSAAATFRMLRPKVDGSLVNVTDRGRVMQDIVLGLLYGAIMGLFVGYIGKGTPDLGLGLSALALLAGYNVSGVFAFLNELCNRVFGRDRLCIEAAASTASPYGPGSAADVQRRRSPRRGENAEHLKMAACVIYKSPLKVISKRRLKMPELKGKSHFQIFKAIFAAMRPKETRRRSRAV